MLNKHKQQIMTSPCKKKATTKKTKQKITTIIKQISIKQVSNAGKYLQPNIANQAQITRHRTLKYISNENHRPQQRNGKISHARKTMITSLAIRYQIAKQHSVPESMRTKQRA